MQKYMIFNFFWKIFISFEMIFNFLAPFCNRVAWTWQYLCDDTVELPSYISYFCGSDEDDGFQNIDDDGGTYGAAHVFHSASPSLHLSGRSPSC